MWHRYDVLPVTLVLGYRRRRRYPEEENIIRSTSFITIHFHASSRKIFGYSKHLTKAIANDLRSNAIAHKCMKDKAMAETMKGVPFERYDVVRIGMVGVGGRGYEPVDAIC